MTEEEIKKIKCQIYGWQQEYLDSSWFTRENIAKDNVFKINMVI
jgi:hypothetical protein